MNLNQHLDYGCRPGEPAHAEYLAFRGACYQNPTLFLVSLGAMTTPFRVWVARCETGGWETWVPSESGMRQVGAGFATREAALQAGRKALKTSAARRTAWA